MAVLPYRVISCIIKWLKIGELLSPLIKRMGDCFVVQKFETLAALLLEIECVQLLVNITAIMNSLSCI